MFEGIIFGVLLVYMIVKPLMNAAKIKDLEKEVEELRK